VWLIEVSRTFWSHPTSSKFQGGYVRGMSTPTPGTCVTRMVAGNRVRSLCLVLFVTFATGPLLASCSTPSRSSSPTHPSIRTGSSTSVPVTPTSTSPDASFGTGEPACQRSNLRLAWNLSVSPETQEEPIALTLLNTASSPCTLDGYPTVVLSDTQGISLPFVYSHTGDIMVTSGSPQSVLVNPGHIAGILINKASCTSGTYEPGDPSVVSTFAIIPPGSVSALTVKGPSEPLIAFCGSGQTGSTVAVSPIEPTVELTLATS
jgi:hypothetical protein